jgi:hypothetical protein
VSTLDQFIDAKARKAQLQRDLTLVQAEIDALERTVLDEFAAEGIRAKRDERTGKLVSIRRQLWARAAGDRFATAQALLDHGGHLAELVKPHFDYNSLSSYFRELADERAQEGDPVIDPMVLVPDDLRPYIALTDDHTLSVTAGQKGRTPL